MGLVVKGKEKLLFLSPLEEKGKSSTCISSKMKKEKETHNFK